MANVKRAKASPKRAPKSKSKTTVRTVKKFDTRLLLLIPILFLLFLYGIRGWIRMNVIPGMVSVASGNNVQSTFDDEMQKLRDPFAILGYSNKSIHSQGCGTISTHGLSTAVVCNYAVTAWQEIFQDAVTKIDLDARATTLQTLLEQNGWQGSYADGSENTLKKLASNIATGVDYYPDATYTKEIGELSCTMMNSTAFTRPSPPAMSILVNCSREYHILGDPAPVLYYPLD